MKKMILFAAVFIALTTAATAQRAAERKEEIKKGLKDEVKLTEEQIAQVVSIDEEYRPKLREIKNNATLSDDEKKAKTKAMNEEKKAKLETLLGKEKAAAVQTFYTEIRKKKDNEPKKDQ